MAELFHPTGKEEGYLLAVNLPNQAIADKYGLVFRFEIAPARKEVLLKGLDDIGTTIEDAGATDAHEKAHTTTANMHGPRRREAALQRPVTIRRGWSS